MTNSPKHGVLTMSDSMNGGTMEKPVVSRLVDELEQNGIAVLPRFLDGEQLQRMQQAFGARLRRMRWNDVDGYERTDLLRHMVQDVLTLDQGFLDAALHPTVKAVLTEYLGPHFVLSEAKGWKSLPTMKDLHGWHGDAWYDQKKVDFIPREVKLVIYLTDVKTGAFNYIKGTHGKEHPRGYRNHEIEARAGLEVVSLTGVAGTAALFDTSGIHRQEMPILEPREAVFLNYHDPSVPLQQEDIAYYRYHPLTLNAAFLGNLSREDQRILGFGNKTNYIHAFERTAKYSALQDFFRIMYEGMLRGFWFRQRIHGRLKRTIQAQSKK